MKLSRKSEEHRHRRNRQMAEAQRLLEDNCISNSPAKSPQRYDQENSSSFTNEGKANVFQKDALNQATSNMINIEERSIISEFRNGSIQNSLETGEPALVRTLAEKNIKHERREPSLINESTIRSHLSLKPEDKVPGTEKPLHLSPHLYTEMNGTPEHQPDRR